MRYANKYKKSQFQISFLFILSKLVVMSSNPDDAQTYRNQSVCARIVNKVKFQVVACNRLEIRE